MPTPAAGETVAGTFRRRLSLSSGRFAMIDGGLGFARVRGRRRSTSISAAKSPTWPRRAARSRGVSDACADLMWLGPVSLDTRYVYGAWLDLEAEAVRSPTRASDLSMPLNRTCVEVASAAGRARACSKSGRLDGIAAMRRTFEIEALVPRIDAERTRIIHGGDQFPGFVHHR
jgi:hypothetical protein